MTTPEGFVPLKLLDAQGAFVGFVTDFARGRRGSTLWGKVEVDDSHHGVIPVEGKPSSGATVELPFERSKIVLKGKVDLSDLSASFERELTSRYEGLPPVPMGPPDKEQKPKLDPPLGRPDPEERVEFSDR